MKNYNKKNGISIIALVALFILLPTVNANAGCGDRIQTFLYDYVSYEHNRKMSSVWQQLVNKKGNMTSRQICQIAAGMRQSLGVTIENLNIAQNAKQGTGIIRKELFGYNSKRLAKKIAADPTSSGGFGISDVGRLKKWIDVFRRATSNNNLCRFVTIPVSRMHRLGWRKKDCPR
ncbi:MAG: hypothetical protein HQL69_21045 [Magnetococcales bacterium]|nr:hypothetical protein [Magnetococcales bacterium]